MTTYSIGKSQCGKRLTDISTIHIKYLFSLFTDIDNCAPDAAGASRCIANQGICIDEVNDYKCVCFDGYEGLRCETSE